MKSSSEESSSLTGAFLFTGVFGFSATTSGEVAAFSVFVLFPFFVPFVVVVVATGLVLSTSCINSSSNSKSSTINSSSSSSTFFFVACAAGGAGFFTGTAVRLILFDVPK